MVLGVGLDIVEIARIARALAVHGQRFAERVYTPGELAACASRADRAQALAGRFAAKEAFLKAMGTGWVRGVSLRQVEVVECPGGMPAIQLMGGAADRAQRKQVRTVHLSITHQPGLAAAVVILEG